MADYAGKGERAGVDHLKLEFIELKGVCFSTLAGLLGMESA